MEIRVSIALFALVSCFACDKSTTGEAGEADLQAAGIGSGVKLSPRIARETLLRPDKTKPREQDPPKQAEPEPEPITGEEVGPLIGLRKAHDTARAKVGAGPLQWSKKVAISAQEWANELAATQCQLAHDSARSYGENLYMQSSSMGQTPVSAAEVVGSWTAEAANYDAANHTCAAGTCGHYTQVVWADSRYIGCGMAWCEANQLQTQIWVCRYDPRGNIMGQQPF